MGFPTGFLTALAQAEPGPFWTSVALSSLLGAGAVALGFMLLRRARMLEDIPTSRIRSAAQGYVEFHGHARWLPGPEIRSPLSNERCCWWEFVVQQQRTEKGGGRPRADWVTIERATSDDLFMIDDGTGQCVVDPVGATVVPSLKRSWRGVSPRPMAYRRDAGWFGLGEYRYTERLVRFGDWLYALGQFQTQIASRDDDEVRDVGHRLAEWKRDPQRLLHRFDADRDGRIDVAEWDVARRAAVAEVRAEHTERNVAPARVTVPERSEAGADAGRSGASRTHLLPQDTVSAPDLHVLSRPRDRRPFILSTRTEHELTRGMRWGGLAAVVAGLLVGAVVSFLLIARGLA